MTSRRPSNTDVSRGPLFWVEVIPNPNHPDSEEHAERARQIVDEVLTASGYPDRPPRRLRLVRDTADESEAG